MACLLQDLCINVLFAGHETTAKAILVFLRTLKEHPDNIDILLEEQKKVKQPCCAIQSVQTHGDKPICAQHV